MNQVVEVSTAVAEPREVAFPIAEMFGSPQGEGNWSGTYFHFIRMAGCTVGRPYSQQERISLGLKVYQEKCRSYDGQSFSCDTNYRMATKMTVSELVAETGDTLRVCLTGGEPLMHHIEPLITALLKAGKRVHIETSGTIDTASVLSAAVSFGVWKLWICVSPKFGYIPSVLDSCNEIKVLVGQHFDEAGFIAEFGKYMNRDKVFIQPVNDEVMYNRENMARCVDLQKKYQSLRLSLQIHKLLRCK
jgi:organic radical activating enzyme